MECILFLRGINLGKVNKVPMSQLREFLINFGFTNVKTYLQSGNAYVESKTTLDLDKLEQALAKQFGFSIPVLTRTIEELRLISNHPMFLEDNVMVLFVKDSSRFTEISELIEEEYELINDNIILKYSLSYHKTKFNNNWFERKLQTQATIRNKNTVLKIIELFNK